MVSKSSHQSNGEQTLIGDVPSHVVFVLDESGSMCNDWEGVVNAFH